MPVNGTYYGWEDLTVLLPTGPAFDLTEINSDVTRDVELVYGQGTAPRGRGRGNFKGEGSLKMKREEYMKLQAYALAAGKSIFTLAPFTITAAYLNTDQGLSVDQYLRCTITGSKKKVAQGDKTAEVELPFVFEDLEENGQSLTAGMNLL